MGNCCTKINVHHDKLLRNESYETLKILKDPSLSDFSEIVNLLIGESYFTSRTNSCESVIIESSSSDD